MPTQTRALLVNARRERGLTQTAAAERIGIGRATLRRLEAGRGRHHPGTLRRVLDFYELPHSIAELWPLDDDEPEGVAA